MYQKWYPMKPYDYQRDIFSKIRQEWEKNPGGVGNIVYLETGMGKTHIATMLLNYLFEGRTYEDESSELVPHSDEDVEKRLEKREQELSELDIANLPTESRFTKKVFFIVPVQNLID